MERCVQLKRYSFVFVGRLCHQNSFCTKSVHRARYCITPLALFTGALSRRSLHRSVTPSTSRSAGARRPTISSVLRRFYPTIGGMASNRNQKTINFQDYDVFGFDLDHTLAKYKIVPFLQLVHDCVASFLVDEKGYDASLKDDLHKYKDFISKGLFLDINKGNILKLGHDGTILRATHGTHLLSKASIQEVYGEEMIWDQATVVQKTLRNSTSEFRFFENYFDCPGLVATARIIDMIDQKSETAEERQKLYIKAWEDTLQALINMYFHSQFAAGKGGYFPAVKKEPSKYVEECSADIRRWLKLLKQKGKMVFLLSSSQIDYASCILEVCLGKEWQSYFDISLLHGRKPAFFTDNNPFYALDQHKEGAVVANDDIQRNGCYSQGNLEGFNKFLARELGKEEVKVLYFGDNICADCYPSKQFSDWDVVLILEEMDAEGYVCIDHTVPGHEDDADSGALQPGAKKRRVLEHSSLVTLEEMDYLLTEFWGPFLVHQEDKMSERVETFWGDVISRYSDIAVPSLEYLAGVPVDHNFERFSGTRGSISGFHPGPPSSLLP